MYVCIEYMHVRVYGWMGVFVHACAIWINGCVYVSMFAWVSVWVYMFKCACVYVYMFVCACACGACVYMCPLTKV